MAMQLTDLFPTQSPTITDALNCKTENLWRYLNNPMPTGKFRKAVESYSTALFSSCIANDQSSCKSHTKGRWCQMQSALPQDLWGESLHYGNKAYSWWSTHSSKAVSLAHECPHHWYDINQVKPLAGEGLNLTIKFAECIAEGRAMAGSSTLTMDLPSKSSSTPAAMATAGSTAIFGSTATITSPQATDTSVLTGKPSNGAINKCKGKNSWIILVAGLMVGVICEIL
jgi:hypothetical protein